MTRYPTIDATALLLTLVAGCTPNAIEPPAASPTPSAVQRPASAPASEIPSPRTAGGKAEISWDTEQDHRFADFLRDRSGGMVRKAAVGIERKGLLQVELDKSVGPDETLPLTKSLMAGARKDFPDRPITLKIFDPTGQPVLTARYHPDRGISYQIAQDDSPRSGGSSGPDRQSAEDAKALDRSGVTEADRKFATWAEEHGRAYLRYVQADLERHGRLWFGVTRNVKPADVPELTKSLLEGAMKEFPKRELKATVFDPEGERIGVAHLDARGRIRWDE